VGVPRDARAQRTRQRDEVQRGFEHKRLTIEPYSNGRTCTDFELERRPLENASKATLLADSPEGDQLGHGLAHAKRDLDLLAQSNRQRCPGPWVIEFAFVGRVFSLGRPDHLPVPAG
jgi:hypothetical protein